MKRIIILSFFIAACTICFSQNVGIGTVSPLARLHVADSNVVFTGSGSVSANTPYGPPVEGAGVRMMWYPQKAAFRAGLALTSEWDKANIGIYSVALGVNTIASGESSIALGYGTRATNIYSTAIGNSSQATAYSSTALGFGCFATGLYSFAAGYNSRASGVNAMALGYHTTSTGDVSYAFGKSTISRANGAMAMGNNTIARSPNSLVIGILNDTTNTDRLFEIGNGTAFNALSNALTVLTNGNIGIGETNPSRPLSFEASLGEKILLYPGSAGEVGIGVYGNELRLHCDNPGSMVSFGTQNNAGVFTQAGRFQISAPYALFVNGSIWANGNTYASDERFKQNITPIQSPLQKLLQINGVEYEMKAGSFQKNNFQKGRQIGLLAQNVEKVIPEAVNEMDGYKGVDYAKLVPLLIESIKEQQKQIEELKKLIQNK